MKLLEVASNVAVIIAAGAIAVTSIYGHVARPKSGGATSAMVFSERYKSKRIPLPRIETGTGVTTLVLFVSSSCHFCEESMPFYRRLADMRSGSAGRFKTVAAVPQAVETEAGARAYFSERGLAVDEAQRAPFRAIGVTATPTLALVGSDGIVVDVWTGKLPPSQEAEVVKRIEDTCHGCSPAGSGGAMIHPAPVGGPQ